MLLSVTFRNCWSRYDTIRYDTIEEINVVMVSTKKEANQW